MKCLKIIKDKMWEQEKMLVTGVFSFSHNFFLSPLSLMSPQFMESFGTGVLSPRPQFRTLLL